MQGLGMSAVTAYTAHREWANRPPDERYASVEALHEAAVPSKNRVRRHDRCRVRQQPAAETGAEDRETPPVVVSEAQTLSA